MKLIPLENTLELSEVTLIELGKVMRQQTKSPEDASKAIMLSGSYYELKKLWHDKLDIQPMSIANDISDAVSPTDLVNRLKAYLDMSEYDQYDLGVRFDEIGTVRLNRLLNHYSELGETSIGKITVESFINDYNELIAIADEYPEGDRIKDALQIMLQTLKSEDEYVSVDPETEEPIIKISGTKEYFACNEREIEASIASYKTMLNVNVALFPLYKAFLYTDNITYARDLKYAYQSGLVITPGCGAHDLLTDAYNNNRAFQQNKYATLVADIAYSEEKLYEVYATHEGNFKIVSHYVN